MHDCECLPKCPFFNDKMSNMPQTTEMYKKKFCKKDNSNCARYIVFKVLGRELVPTDLYPTSIDKAYKIIRGIKT